MLRQRILPQVPGVLKYAADKRGKRQLSKLVERNKLYFRHIVRGSQIPAAHSCQTVYDNSVLVGRIYDLVDSELLLHVDFEACFLFQFANRGLRDALKGFYFPAGQNPTATLRILIAFSQQDAVRLIPDNDC